MYKIELYFYIKNESLKISSDLFVNLQYKVGNFYPVCIVEGINVYLKILIQGVRLE